MSNPYVGEIRLVPYNFAPLGWMFCDGSLLPISEYETLFILIGTTYGGDGQSTFGLPDLRGRAALGTGTAVGSGTTYTLGEQAGSESVQLTSNQMPAHSHSLGVHLSAGTMITPVSNRPAPAPLASGNAFSNSAVGIMPADTVSQVGTSAAHENRQPFLAMHYIISLFGVFPTQ